MPETQVQSLGQEDPLEEEMATHSMDRGGWRSIVHGGHEESDTNEYTHTHPLQLTLKNDIHND